MTAVGMTIPRVDGRAKVTGAAQYTADLELPGMLVTRALRSPYPHARVLRVDASKAARLPGVVVLTGEDLHGMHPFFGPVVKDQPIVAIDRVRYVGDLVAAVAAEADDLAEEALDLIEVDYEPLPAVFDPLEAMQPTAPLLHERTAADVASSRERSIQPGLEIVHLDAASNVISSHHFEQGDVDAAFAEADEVFEDTYSVPTIQHGHIEPHAAMAQWDGSGRLVLHSSTQDPWVTRTELAQLFGLPLSRVRVTVPYVGGGYGAKLYPRVEPVVAALARKARRPVQWVLTREEVFLTIVRHAAVVRLKTGVRRDGRLLARQVEVIYDAGAYAEISPRVAAQNGPVSGGPYRVRHLRADLHCVYTNKPPAGAFRGFGVPQICWAYESQMDDVARRLGVDPLELRLRNVLREGDVFLTGERMVSVGIADCLRQAAEAVGWQGQTAATATSTARPGLVRGRGLAAAIKSTMTPSNSAASVRLDADGSAQLLTSSVEIGQASTTVLAQIVADAIGIPVEQVGVTLPDTDVTPFDHGTKSSRITFSVGKAAQQAGEQIRQQLLDAAARIFEVAPDDLEIERGVVTVKGAPDRRVTIPRVFQAQFGLPVGNLFGSHVLQTTGGIDPVTGKGKDSAFWMWAAAAAEVEVDTETGKVRVLRLATATDTGTAINPGQCHLQNEGSALMGLGSALFEEMVFQDGQPINASFLSYMLPSMEDFPDEYHSLLVQTPHPDGPFGAKGMGEVGLVPTAPAIGNAVANALGGARVRDLPLRPDRVLAALESAREG